VASEQEVTLCLRQANSGQTFAFVQFEQQESATTALTLAGMQLGDKPIKVFPAKLPPVLVAHGGKGGDMGAMQKAMDVQARFTQRMAERKAKQEADAAAKEARKAAGGASDDEEKKRDDTKGERRDRKDDRDRDRTGTGTGTGTRTRI